MVIQSTTLDTESKVIKVYGGNGWTQITNRFLFGTGTITMYNDSGVATSTNVTAKSTGGSISSTLSVDTIPAHNHSTQNGGQSYSVNSVAVGSNLFWAYPTAGMPSSIAVYSSALSGLVTGNKGGSKPHNNMPPYYGVYIWERTS